MPTILLSLFYLTTAYLAILAIYRLTLHQLAKYPGPFFSRISDLSIFFQTLTQRRHVIHLEEHRIYGPVVRIAPNTLSFSSPEALRQIYQIGQRNNQLRKAAWYEIIDAPVGAFSLHTEVSRHQHAAHRKILDQAFSSSALRTYEPSIYNIVNVFKSVVAPDSKEGWSVPRNMKEYANWFTYDVMGELVFGRRFDCLTDKTHRSVPRIMMASSAFTYMAGYLPFQSIVRRMISSSRLMNLFGGELGRDEHAYVQYATSCMSARLDTERVAQESSPNTSTKPEHKDMMHHIIKASHIESKADTALSRAELDADASLLIAAGSDTTALTLAALFFYLTLPACKPILHKLQAEIRDVVNFSSNSSIDIDSATKLPYLRACLDEALRLAPAVPTHLPRTIVAEHGINIDGTFVPAGTTVGASAYVLHHDEAVFTRSWTFDPERWLISADPTPEGKATKNEQIRRQKQSFIAFSLGSRGCIGRELAYREMSYCMAQLIYEFDFRRAEHDVHRPDSGSRPETNDENGRTQSENEYILYDCFLADRVGPLIEFRRANWRK